MTDKLLGIDDLLTNQREAVLRLAEQHGAYNVRVFGSVARGEARSDSDIDLLVDLKPGCTQLDLIALKQALERLLHRNVDVISAASLREEIRAAAAEDLTSLETTPILARTRKKPFVRDVRLYLRDILERISRIKAATRDGKTAFMESEIIQDAVIRSFEVMGEAAKRLPAHLTDAHPEVNWSKVAGLRDVLIHQYDKIDLELVWNHREQQMPLLENAVDAILKSIDQANDAN